MKNKDVILNNGHKMPIIGLGTSRMVEKDEVLNAIECALKIGYRLIDTAYFYGNEMQIGDALKFIFDAGQIKRNDIFITSKLWNSQHDDPAAAIDLTLKKLQIDRLDLYLIHFPVKFKMKNGEQVVDKKGNIVIEDFECEKLWRKMEELVKKKKTNSIGLCNFGIENLNKILKMCTIKPAVLQLELHPYINQDKILTVCRENGISITGYSSLGSLNYRSDLPLVREDSLILDISIRLGKTPSQVVLSYLVSQNIAVIPKSKSKIHLEENIELFEMDKNTIEEIDKLKEKFSVRYVDVGHWRYDKFK